MADSFTRQASTPAEAVDEIIIGGLPLGIWRGTLQGVDLRTIADDETGELKQLYGWTWTVELEDGTVPFRVSTSTSTGPRSTLAAVVAALNPDATKPGARLNVSRDLVGRSAQLVVEHLEGRTRIAAYAPDRPAKAAKA